MHFDTAVNQGVGTAARILQEAADVTIDGVIGPETRAAVWRKEQTTLLEKYAEIRRRRYRALSHFWRFGRGWLSRVDTTLATAKTLIASSGQSPITTTTTKGTSYMPANDTPRSDQQPEEKWWGESLTIWGSIITGLSTVLPVIGPLFGLNLTSELVVLLGEDLVRVGQAIGGLMGTLMVIQGRIRATTRLTTRQLTVRL